MELKHKRRITAQTITARLNAMAGNEAPPAPEALEQLKQEIERFIISDRPIHTGPRRGLGFFMSLSASLATNLRDTAQAVQGRDFCDQELAGQLAEVLAGCEKRIAVSRKQARPKPETLARRRLAELAEAGEPLPSLDELMNQVAAESGERL